MSHRCKLCQRDMALAYTTQVLFLFVSRQLCDECAVPLAQESQWVSLRSGLVHHIQHLPPFRQSVQAAQAGDVLDVDEM